MYPSLNYMVKNSRVYIKYCLRVYQCVTECSTIKGFNEINF